MLTHETMKNNIPNIKDKIKAEYCTVYISTLGGINNTSIIIRLSLDKKENWKNGIFHNSKYYIFHIDKYGVIENFSCDYKLKKIRKKTVKTIDEAIEYINKKIERIKND